MNATCKRLLSWLVVLTMVLSMVPVLDLSNFAVTTKAAENPAKDILTAIEAQSADFAGKTGTVIAKCPVCGTEQEWTALSGTDLAAINSVGAGNTGRNYYHYYLSDAASFSGSAFTFTTNGATTCVNLNGKALTAGNRAIVLNYGSTINIMDTNGGSITGKSTGQNGAAIYVANPSGIVNIYGGTFKRSTDSHANSSVVRMQGYGGTINMYDGVIDATTVTGNTAQPGVYMVADENRTAIFNMYGGEIVGTETTSDGGAVYLTKVTTVNKEQKFAKEVAFNLYGGTISGGSGRAGGNIMVYAGALNISGGTVSGGKSTNNHASVTGGNIGLRDGASLYMEGGVVCNGKAVQNGGNIALWYSNNNTVEIVGGKIYGGVAGTAGANIYSNGLEGSALIIGGTAEIAGDIKTNHTTTNTLTGTPKIQTSGLYAADGETAVTGTKGYEVLSNTNLNVTGVTGGKIQVTGDAGIAFSAVCDNAATVAQYFEATGAKLAVAANDANQLVIVESAPERGKFEPWKHGGMAYCDACIAAGLSEEEALVEWTPISGTGLAAINSVGAGNTGRNYYHYYLSDAASFSGSAFTFTTNGATTCVNLNGKALTAGNRAIVLNYGSTINIMDTNGGSITGKYTGQSGAAIYVANPSGIVNIYGGTFKRSTDSHASSSVVRMQGYGGTINMYDGVIDATTVTGNTAQPGVYMVADENRTAIFNMYGGEIVGTETTGDGGAVYVTNVTTVNKEKKFAKEVAFNLYGGTIRDGVARAGGNVVVNGGTFNMEEGTISGGESTNNNANVAGGNVWVRGGGTFRMEGGVVCNGKSVQCGGNIQVYTAEVGIIEISDGQIYGGIVGVDGSAIKNTGEEGSRLNITGGTISGDIFTGGAVEMDFAGLTKDTLVALAGDATLDLAEDQELCVDNRGNTVTVTGKGTLYAIDSANDDYNGYGAWIVEEGVKVANDVINPVNGNRYIAIKNPETGKYTAHRIEMYLTKVSLRAKAAGIYYRAAYKCDTTLAARIGAYGVALSLDAIPTLEAIQELNPAVKLTALEGFATAMKDNTVDTTSAIVTNIFKADVDNAARGNAAIYATPYVAIDFDGDGDYLADNGYVVAYVADNAAWNVENKSFAQKSMNDVLAGVPAVWETLTAAQQAANREIFSKWATEWSVELPEGFDAILNPEA